MTAEHYIQSIEAVLAPHFAPDGYYRGVEGAMRLARDVGYGLRDSPAKEASDIIGSLYTRLLVRFTLSSGVPVDAKPWFAEIRKAMRSGTSF